MKYLKISLIVILFLVLATQSFPGHGINEELAIMDLTRKVERLQRDVWDLRHELQSLKHEVEMIKLMR